MVPPRAPSFFARMPTRSGAALGQSPASPADGGVYLVVRALAGLERIALIA
jgi:hypothetical protein